MISNEEYFRLRNEEWRRLERKYDFNSIQGIKAIPVPCEEVNGDSPTGRVEYYLRGICFRKHWESGEKDLAIECLRKAQDLMFVSNMIWKYDDFIRLVSYLHEIGLHDEARLEETKIENHFESVGLFPNLHFWNFKSLRQYFSWKKEIENQKNEFERKKQLRHEYYWLQENASEVCPKSISGYSRMKNLKSKKYIELKTIAEKQNFMFLD